MSKSPAKSNFRVLIVGAGPTGLTLASELTRRGVHCRIIDVLTERSPHSKAISISASSLQIFNQMGILPAFLSLGRKVHDIYVHAQGGRRVHVDYRHLEKKGGITHPFILSLGQPCVEKILEDHLQQQNISVERGIEFVDFTETSEGVAVTLKTRSGETEVDRFDSIVRCDGSRSLVRKQLKIKLDGGGYDHSFIHGEFKLKWNGEENAVHYFMDDHGFWLIVPMPDDWYRIVIQVPSRHPESVFPSLSMKLFQDLISPREGHEITLKEARHLSYARLNHLVAHPIRQGRVFLAGDAFHQFSPVGGQGMNTGLQDAFNLAWKLAYVAKGRAKDSLLDTYEKERQPLAKELMLASDASMQLLLGQKTGPSQLENLKNNLISGFANRARHRKQWPFKFSGISQSYSKGSHLMNFSNTPAAQYDAEQKPMAGWRAPEAGLELIRSLEHRLVIFLKKETSEVELHALRKRFGGWLKIFFVVSSQDSIPNWVSPSEIIDDPDRKISTAYQADSGDWVLVRPDGYIEANGSDRDLRLLQNFLSENYLEQITHL